MLIAFLIGRSQLNIPKKMMPIRIRKICPRPLLSTYMVIDRHYSAVFTIIWKMFSIFSFWTKRERFFEDHINLQCTVDSSINYLGLYWNFDASFSSIIEYVIHCFLFSSMFLFRVLTTIQSLKFRDGHGHNRYFGGCEVHWKPLICQKSSSSHGVWNLNSSLFT